NTDQLAEDQTGTLSYDPSGELAANGDWQFDYDYVSKLVTQMSGGGNTLSCTFGASPQRLVKAYTSNGATQSRVYLPGAGGRSASEVVQAPNQTASETRYIRSRLGTVAMQTVAGGSSDLLYVVRDYLGSTRLIVDTDGNVVVSFDYDPYG